MKRYNSCYNSANLSNRGQIISNHVYENVSVFPPNFPSSIRAMESPRRSWVESENIPPPPPRRDRTRTASRRFLNSISPLNCSYLDEIVARLEQIQVCGTTFKFKKNQFFDEKVNYLSADVIKF